MPKVIALLALVAGVVVTPALGATRLEPPDSERYLRWGMFRVRPGFELSDFGYDDNIFASNSNKVSDITATLSPKLEGLVLFGDRAFMTFIGQLDYTLYAENSGQNFLDHRTSARFTLPVRRAGLFVSAGNSKDESRPADETDLRPKVRDTSSTFGFIVEPGWRTEVELAYTLRDLRYTDPDLTSIGDRLDRDEKITTIKADYKLFGRTRLNLELLHKSIDFEVPELMGGVPRNTRENQILVGVNFGEGGLLSGTFDVGWDRIDAEDPSLVDFSDIVGSAELVYRFTYDTKVQLEASRAPAFSVLEDNSYFLNTSYGYRVVHYLTRIIGLETGLETGKLEFPPAASGLVREDDLLSFDVGLRFRLSTNARVRRVEYSLKFGRNERTSNIESQNRTQNTVNLSAVVGY